MGGQNRDGFRQSPVSSVEGETSAERLRVGRVSAKTPTSRKEREKWGTRSPAVLSISERSKDVLSGLNYNCVYDSGF